MSQMGISVRLKSLPPIFMVVLLSIHLFSCVEDDDGNGNSDNNNNILLPLDYDPSENTVVPTNILELVNAYRDTGCNCGSTSYPAVPRLSWNQLLENSAYRHGRDMDENNYFSHIGQNGSTPADRVAAEGYEWLAIGENIANGYTSEEAVIEAWIDSPDHCKNIMSGNFTEMGMGRSGNYWVQDFGKPR